MRLEQVVEALPAEFDQLRAESSAEGHRFLDRLANDWTSGVMRFERPGEMLLAAYSDDMLAVSAGSPSIPKFPRRCACAGSISAQLFDGLVSGVPLPRPCWKALS